VIAPEVVIAEARSWIDTPFQHGQSCKGAGCDCIGYIAGVDTNVGLPEGAAFLNDSRYKGYGRTPNPALLLQACDDYMDRIDIKDAGLADVLVFRLAGQPHHFGIVSSLDPMYIVHSIANKKVARNRVDEKWNARIMRAYRLRGVG
jgi:NlpC/P60 family putative phage cell wall peptidase